MTESARGLPLFVSERITPVAERFDIVAMARGEPSVPKAFTWRGQCYEVATVFRSERRMGSDRGDAYVRRHYYDVETADALRLRLYFERNPSDRSKGKAWWLYTLTYPEPVIRTARLCLRRWTFADRDAFRAMTQEPEVMRFIHEGKPLDDEQADNALANTIERYGRLGYGDWAIDAPDGEIAGESGLGKLPETGEVDIGWMLKQRYWGNGFALEAASAVRDYAAGTLGMHRLVALTDPANARSIALAEKLGMSATGNMLHGGRIMRKFEIQLGGR